MRLLLLAGTLAAVSLFTSAASAAVVVITQQKALAGGVTPGDTPGFPVTLSRRGAYRVDTDLVVPAGAIGIQLRSNYVDLDMNGFTLYGWNSAGTIRAATYGIDSAFGVGKIRDGFITGFKFDGIRLRDGAVAGSSNQMVISNMTIQSNGRYGIDGFESSYTRILGSSINANGSTGVWCASFCLIEGNVIGANADHGVGLLSGTVLGNTIADNGGIGVVGNSTPAATGAGNNTLISNGSGQMSGVIDLEPNACMPGPC